MSSHNPRQQNPAGDALHTEECQSAREGLRRASLDCIEQKMMSKALKTSRCVTPSC